MQIDTMQIETVSVDSVMLYFKPLISEEVLDQVQQAYLALRRLEHLIEFTPSYHSILIRYDLRYYDDKTIKHAIQKQLDAHTKRINTKYSRLIEIPVDYSCGWDLERVATLNRLSTQEVIARHIQATYRVYAIGFMVGFAYLAKVDESIATPRLDSPRDTVPKGSIAIADTQTAIYPQNSAGGWNIIGHTEFEDFSSFQIGDSVRFLHV